MNSPRFNRRRRLSSVSACMRNFIDSKLVVKHGRIVPLTGYKFQEIWKHYDRDRSGFLEGKEIDAFLRDFLTSTCSGTGDLVVNQHEVEEFRRNFMLEFDVDQDGRISISELVSLLPVEESVYVAFRLEAGPTRGVDYMKIWHKYDQDDSGYIEASELKRFLKDIANNTSRRDSDSDGPLDHLDDAQLDAYAATIMNIYDANQDGRLSLSELAKLLPREENFVQLLVDKTICMEKLTEEDVSQLLERYDKDHSGLLEGEEITQLAHEILLITNPESYTADEVYTLQQGLMQVSDVDKDGRLDRRELRHIITTLVKCRRAATAPAVQTVQPTGDTVQ